jgi:glycopeptide antibiotics resistance protein
MPAPADEPTKLRRRALLIAMFVIYLALLVWIILWKLEKPWIGEAAMLPRPIKLVPFLPSGDAGASNPEEVVANILLFVPFGLYLGSLARSWRWWQLTGVFLGASLLLETAQHLLSTGSFDTSDLISNTAGGLAGLGILALARRRFGARLPAIGVRVAVIGTAVSVIAIAALIVSPLRYGPQHDVIVPRHATGAAELGGPRLGV